MKKNLPARDLSELSILNLPYEAVKWEILKTAIELHLFDQTTEPATADEIAAALSLHPGNTRYTLDALVALGSMSKSEGRYLNTPMVETFFTSGMDTYLGSSILYMVSWNEPLLNGGLKRMLQEGPPPVQDMSDPAIWEQGARASIAYARSGRAQELARLVSELPEFPSFTKILDMGAGPGSILFLVEI